MCSILIFESPNQIQKSPNSIMFHLDFFGGNFGMICRCIILSETLCGVQTPLQLKSLELPSECCLDFAQQLQRSEKPGMPQCEHTLQFTFHTSLDHYVLLLISHCNRKSIVFRCGSISSAYPGE